MRIGLNLLFLIPTKVGGSETFVRALVGALEKYDRENTYILFCNKENHLTFKPSGNIQTVEVPISASNKILRIIYEQILFPIFIRKYNLDVLHSLGYISPFWLPVKSIVNIIDLNWYYHPEDFGLVERLVWKFMVVNSAKYSNAITTISKSSKKSLKKILHIKKPIEVIYMGEPTLENPDSKNDLIKKGIKFPYLFSLTSAHPHKNVLGLLMIFKMVVDKGSNLNLVIAGLGGRNEGKIRKFIEFNSLSGRVKILGYVSDSTMSTLFKYAKAFVFTSMYEGFGIPILESFHYGTPVISSNAFSLKEVVGDGGIQLNPNDYGAFLNEIIKLSTNQMYYRKLSSMSKMRSTHFDWKNEVNKLKLFYKKVL